MDLLRLPPALRHHLVSTLRYHQAIRPLTTQALAHSYTPPPPPPPPSEPLEPLLALSPATLNAYNTSIAPNADQLKHAHAFFASSPPHILFSAAHFRQLPSSSHPEIAFLGRSNVGKSSLLNALFNTPTNHTAYVSKKPGKTRTMNGFGIGGAGMGLAPREGEKEAAWKRFGRGGIVVVDMPGYGGGSREEWGQEALKYLAKRKQLRRTFLLVDAEHGLKRTDLSLLTHLRQNGIPYTIVLSKADKLLYPGAKVPGPQRLSNGLMKLRRVHEDVREELREAFNDGRNVTDDILCCSAEKSLDKGSGWRVKLGVDELRYAALSACGLESDFKGLPKKRASVRDYARLEADEEDEVE